jgi:hypothetical protein
MKLKWRAIRDCFDPSIICRVYAVDCMNWNNGYTKYFWFKYNAVRYAHRQISYLFVDVTNKITGTRIRVIDNPEKIQSPIQYANLYT